MTSSCRAFVITGTAVLTFCLAVSFGPHLLFGGVAPTADTRASASAAMGVSSTQPELARQDVVAGPSCAGCVTAVSR